ncbi:MAG TPA: pirin family protein [Vicinamibacterales bacterium]|nr:pirin family protein [Vicinamibacterales bacterium]
MSDRSDPAAGARECSALGAAQHEFEAHPNREMHLGALAIDRALPIRERRLVGPWCFLDRFGPMTFSDGQPMDVAPHPHIGLQTVTWLHEGEIVHDDSLGYESVLRPGGVNVMTSGAGIAHAEQTPRDNTGRLNGVQLWTALPDAHRQMAPGFAHLAEVPAIESPAGIARVFAGELGGARSSAPYYSPLLGADIAVHAGHELDLPLDRAFEHAVLLLSGDCSLNGQPLESRTLYYLGLTRAEICFKSRGGARILLIGGPPFPETILMWWNFVARTPDEIRQARADWEQQIRFGDVKAYKGPRLTAPPLTRFSAPNPVS